MGPRKSAILVLAALALWTAPCFASLSDPVSLLKNARAAVERRDRKAADFYAARWLGLCSDGKPAGCDAAAFDEFIARRQLEPKAFVPAEWDPGFIKWFEESLRPRWAVDESRIREKARSFEIAHALHADKYYVTVVAYPALELWHVADKTEIRQPMILAMGSQKDRPAVYFGKLVNNSPLPPSKPIFLSTQKRTLHHLWKPEFHDLDGDGAPELWLRFNIAWGNGFMQVLEAYRIENENALVRIQRFEGGPDGVARRLPDGKVEVSTSKRGVEPTYRTDIWKWEGKEFKKVEEREDPFLINTPGWEQVFTAS